MALIVREVIYEDLIDRESGKKTKTILKKWQIKSLNKIQIISNVCSSSTEL